MRRGGLGEEGVKEGAAPTFLFLLAQYVACANCAYSMPQTPSLGIVIGLGKRMGVPHLFIFTPGMKSWIITGSWILTLEIFARVFRSR